MQFHSLYGKRNAFSKFTWNKNRGGPTLVMHNELENLVYHKKCHIGTRKLAGIVGKPPKRDLNSFITRFSTAEDCLVKHISTAIKPAG
ncbi:hypothetical protein ACLB2K_000346 [Fragaria x ananassa]